MRTVRTALICLMVLPAFSAVAHINPAEDQGTYTYLREAILPIDPGIRLAGIEPDWQPGIRIAQEGPGTSLVPRPRPGGQANIAVVASSDGSILRPRPRPDDEIAQILAGVLAGTNPTTGADGEVLQTASGDIIIPRPRPSTHATILPPAPDSPAEPAPVEVQERATDSYNIDLSRMSLIGVFGTDTARRAVVRMPDGSRVRVAAGSEIAGWNVLAVDPRALRIIRGGDVRLLELP